jgi:4-amino-4-deoxy-L-arabinose transferase-like glycosyltransferase
MLPKDHRSYPWLAAAAGVIVVLRLAIAQPVFSPAIDEPSYVGSAVSMIEAHKLIAPGQHPPLVRWVMAIPLWLDGARLPQCRGQTEIGAEDLGYALGTQVLYESGLQFQTLMRHARLAMLVFPAIVLLYVYLLGRRFGGGVVGLGAVVFFSVDPTFLGQGLWLGADVAGCAGYLAGIYHGLNWLSRGTWKSAAACGVALGLAFSAKFTCFFLVPSLALMALAGALDGRRAPWGRLAGKLGLIVPVVFLVLWATYWFNVGPLSDQAGLTGPTTHLSPDALALRARWEKLPRWVRETPVPMPSFFLAVARLASHGGAGHAAYLNGQTGSRGWWYYFPELLAIKSTIGFLIALLVALFAGRWRSWAARAALIPAGVLLLVAVAGHIDIGIRHILPAIPLLYLFVVQQLSRPRWIWLLAVLVAVSAGETAAIHPDYLSFFNSAAGGPLRGQRYALDSNLDWNQDVIRLSNWSKVNAEGGQYSIRLSGQRNKPLLAALGLDADALSAPLHGGLLCISKNVRLMSADYSWLSRHVPVAHIGYSIDVYQMTGPAGVDEPEDVPAVDDPSAAR